MDFVTLNEKNLEYEHICCALADKKTASGVKLKKDWLRSRFQEGLIFKKANVQGKVFIEYLPAENAWCPIEAKGYMLINCFWVAGSYKGQGYGARLLEECMVDSSAQNGVIVISSQKKKPYLSEKAFFIKRGFEVIDTAPPYFEMLVKQFKDDVPLPKFKDSAKILKLDNALGLTVIYSDQCPFTDYYVNSELDEIQRRFDIRVSRIKLLNKEQAQNAPVAFTTYSAFYNGVFLTHEILTVNKFGKLLQNMNK